jgi:hypothetical protein
MANAVWTDRLAAPLDGLRQMTIIAVARGCGFRSLLGSRERRVAFVVSAHACAALVLTVFFPVPLFVAVPLVLGVPHVVSDLRYLVLRRVTHPGTRALVLLGCAALVVVSAAGLLGVRFDVARLEVLLGVLAVFLAAASPLFVHRERLGPSIVLRAASVLAAVLVVGGVALSVPRAALLVLLHGHNGVALVAWLWIFRTRVRSVFLPLLLIAGATALLSTGWLIPATLRLGMWQAFGTNLLSASDILAPGLPGPVAVALTLSFVFLQSVHYLVWLVLVPMDAESGSGATSFRRSFRSLSRDLGTSGLVLSAGLFVVFAGLGAVSPLRTRHAYLALASFHVWLELAVLGFLVVSGGFRRSPMVLDAGAVKE